MNKTILTPPSASPVVNALRAIGYSAETAIADLVDNSLDARASKIEIRFEYNESNSYIMIKDNGHGMDENTLQRAMSIGSKDPRVNRGKGELGRFGMGLKTASFSMGRRLSVLTQKDGQQYQRCWDLDYVSEINEWELFQFIPPEVRAKMGEMKGNSGTVVLIDKLDRFVKSNNRSNVTERRFMNKVKKVEQHIAFIFHSILEKRASEISINGLTIKPWDPFLRSHLGTFEYPEQFISQDGVNIEVRSYILPHPTSLSRETYKNAEKPGKWYDLQGFYIYRENRLLYYGDWLRLFPKDAPSQLSRIRIDIPNSLDSEWQIDIKKSTVFPPEDILERLRSIADTVRARSRSVFYFKATSSERTPSNIENINPWEQSSKNGQPYFILNRSHPLVKKVLEQLNEEATKAFNAYLQLVQLGCPSNLIGTSYAESKEEAISEEDITILKQLIQAFEQSGVISNKEELADALFALPSLDRFSIETIRKIVEEEVGR
jgi:hypothetical protein